MKKIIATLLTVLLIFTSVSCKNNDTDQNLTNSTIVKTNENNELDAYKIEPANNVSVFEPEYAENVDNKYHVYYFYLGLIKKVPVYSSVALQYMYDTEVTVNFNSLTEEGLSNSVSKSEEIIDTHSYTGGFEFGFEQEVGAEIDLVLVDIKANSKNSQSTDHHWTDNWGKTVSESNSTTSSYLNSYNEGYQEKIEFSEEAGFVKGNYYRMSFYETVKAYGVVIYDVEKEKYSATSQTFLKSNSTVRVWEESKDGAYSYKQEDILDFDIERAISYAISNPLKEIESSDKNNNTDSASTPKASVTMNRYNCNDGNNYDKNEKEESDDWRSRHDGYELGELNLYGCQKIGSYYKVGDESNFAIRYKVLEEPESLPMVGTELTKVENDDATSVKGTNINSRVGKGAYWVRITYDDDSQIQHNKTNIFEYATKGSVIDLVTSKDIDMTKTIKNIEVVVVYELYAGGPGFLGIWWNEYSNWRCEYTFNFAG